METTQKIPLRVFYRTIDDLIINQKSDAAISRATYLLQNFPKNLALYRLLGKAYLDKQEFEHAKIIFNKILEIDPDDFVSHIGLSIISQNLDNFVKARESMLRAYELQPSNESLQNEVKRLHESITGTALEKIRMTRGTLIKMYSRSQLAEQAIAEAHLGIQENPDRVDYRIHLAKMLDFSGKDIDAVQTCMSIIQALPYCHAALLILFKRTASLNKTNGSSIFKSRLSELDPYFAYMKPDTNSVEDIPDITIMVEEEGKQEKTFDDLSSFIQTKWEISTSEQDAIESLNKTEDWNSIISEAVLSKTIGTPINDTTYEEVVIHSDEDVIPLENNKFSLDELTVTTEEVDNVSKDSNGFSKEDYLIQTNETSSKKKFLNKLKPKQTESIDRNDVPNWVLQEDESENKIGDDVNQVREIFPSNSLSADFGNDGMTDHNSPINADLENIPYMKQNVPGWTKENSGNIHEDQNEESLILDDTQRINIISSNPEVIMSQAFDSLEKEDYTFAHKCFSKLIHSDYKLQNLAEQLDNYCQENPKNLDLWLILVEIYKKLGLEEKTLSALVKAQNNLSFK